jgi:hypothetical protein
MKSTILQKIALSFGAVLIGVVMFAAGCYVGFERRVLTEAYAVPTVDKHLMDASVSAMLLHQIDSGRLNDARHLLHLQLEGDILVVDSLLDSSDARTRELARKLFTQIEEYRSKHPDSYQQRAQPDAELTARIDSILQRTADTQKK